MFEDWKRQRAVRRVRPGDDRPLQSFRWWHMVAGPKLFFLPPLPSDGHRAEYAVDIRHYGKQGGEDGGLAHLFVDGRHSGQSRLPARFPVEGGVIEVALSLYGIKRLHYLSSAGEERRLTPDPASAAGRRLRFDREHPTPSRWIGVVSILLLVVGVGLNLLQLLEPILGIPPIVERFGRFESPIHLPLWLNVALGVGAGLGSMERGLRLRYHWALDAVGA